MGATREKVRKLLDEGHSVAEIARRVGVTKQTVCFHKRRLGFPIDEKCNRRYDWDAIQSYYDQGHSMRECQEKFGFSRRPWYEAVQRGAITPRPQAMPIQELVGYKRRSRKHLKGRLIAAGLLEPRCEECGIEEWRDKALSLELHHRNGDGLDNRLENLALLCPNCHSQTPTWGGKNRKAA